MANAGHVPAAALRAGLLLFTAAAAAAAARPAAAAAASQITFHFNTLIKHGHVVRNNHKLQ